MFKAPDYEEKSRAIAEECEAADNAQIIAAREEIFKDLVDSVKLLKNHRISEDASTSLKAIKEHLLLAGLYVERKELSGTVNFTPLKLSQEDFGDE